MGLVEDRLRGRGLAREDFERRDVEIPFDQRRPRAEAGDRTGVERPYLRRDRGTVRVDQIRARSFEPGEMNLGNLVAGDGGEIAIGAEPMVHCIDVDVVDVEQEPASASPRELGDEL